LLLSTAYSSLSVQLAVCTATPRNMSNSQRSTTIQLGQVLQTQPVAYVFACRPTLPGSIKACYNQSINPRLFLLATGVFVTQVNLSQCMF